MQLRTVGLIDVQFSGCHGGGAAVECGDSLHRSERTCMFSIELVLLRLVLLCVLYNLYICVVGSLYTLMLTCLLIAQCFLKLFSRDHFTGFSSKSPGDVWLTLTGNCKEIKRRHYSVGCVKNAEKPQSAS